MIRERSSLPFRHLFIAFIAALSVQFAAAQTSKLDKDLSKELRSFTVVKLDAPAIDAAARQPAGQNRTLSLRASDREFTLDLVPNDLRSPRYRAEETGPGGVKEVPFGGVNTYKGKISGDEASRVRLSIEGNKVEGYFFTASDRFYIEPASHFSRSAQPGEMVVYKAEDLLNPVTFSCGLHIDQKIAAGEKFVAPSLGQTSPETATMRVIEIATDGDFEYTGALGGSPATNADILNTINMLEGVYEDELGITFDVVFQHTWTTADPFAGANLDAVLRSIQAYWNLNYPVAQVPRDVMHLWSGKAMAAAQGWGFIDVICNRPDASYALSGKIDWVPVKYELTAHELGHNLGATHVEEAQSCGNTLMNAQLSTVTPFTFCAASREQIQAHVAASGGCLGSRSVGVTRFDFDGDGKADIGLFRPSGGLWYIMNSRDSTFSIYTFGQAGDKPVTEDYDGDGKSDIALYRSGGWFKLKSSTGTIEGVGFGLPNDLPAPADFDGDGKTDVAVYRPSEGRWYVQPTATTTPFYVIQFGASGDLPVPSDYDGDGRADVNLFRPSDGTWYRLNSRDGAFVAIPFGSVGDQPQIGDFDGDGKADQVIYRPASGSWYVFKSSTSTVGGVGFGLNGDIPVPADFDGDGKTDYAVFRPSNANWYRLQSQDGGFYVFQFGTGTDIPALSR
jgi:hypothetical protein